MNQMQLYILPLLFIVLLYVTPVAISFSFF